MNKQINQLRSGVILSYVNLLLGSVLPFFYTPLMLSMLGEAEHGLYAISSSVIGYLSLLNLGLGSAIVRYVAKYRAENNKEAVERIMGFFLLLYCGIGVIMMLCGWILSENAATIFAQGLTVPEQEKIRILVLIMSFHTAIALPLSAFSSVVSAYERYVFCRIMDIFATIAVPCANLIILYFGFASIGIATVSLIIGLVTLPLYIVYCFRVLRIRPRFAKVPMKLVKEISGFSFFVFLGTLVDMMFWATDKVILGMLVGTVAVSVYQIGSTFNQIVLQLSNSISGVLTPKITGMVVKNKPVQELTALFIRVGRLQFLVIGLIVTGFITFGQAFVQLWVGDAYRTSYWIAVLTLVPLSVPLIQNTGLSIVVAQNKHRFRAIVYFAIAVLNVISTYLVAPYLGGVGAALCSCVSYLLGQGIIMNVYYKRVIGLDIPLFWRTIGKMAVLPLCMMTAGLLLQQKLSLDNWLYFFAAVAVYTGIYCVGMYFLNLNDYEKDIINHILKIRKH